MAGVLATLIAAVIGLSGILYQQQVATNIAQQDAQQQQDREEQNRQEVRVQTYLDDMGALLLDEDQPLRLAQQGDEVSILARAKTLSVLSALDSNHKRNIMQFLVDARLINTDGSVISLVDADLTNANLHSTNLSYADLSRANLAGADLSYAQLHKANLSDTDLYNADLEVASLYEADLSAADLYDADLRAANLSYAQLNGAILTHEGRAKGANSERSADLTDAQLYKTDLSES